MKNSSIVWLGNQLEVEGQAWLFELPVQSPDVEALMRVSFNRTESGDRIYRGVDARRHLRDKNRAISARDCRE